MVFEHSLFEILKLVFSQEFSSGYVNAIGQQPYFQALSPHCISGQNHHKLKKNRTLPVICQESAELLFYKTRKVNCLIFIYIYDRGMTKQNPFLISGPLKLSLPVWNFQNFHTFITNNIPTFAKRCLNPLRIRVLQNWQNFF